MHPRPISNLQFAVSPRMTLNSWISWIHLLSPGFPGLSENALMKRKIKWEKWKWHPHLEVCINNSRFTLSALALHRCGHQCSGASPFCWRQSLSLGQVSCPESWDLLSCPPSWHHWDNRCPVLHVGSRFWIQILKLVRQWSHLPALR